MNHRFLYYFNFLAFVPLLIFTTSVQSHGAKFPDRWAYAFLYTFAPSVVFSVSALAVFTRCDKLWLGTNLWFALLGALALSRAWGPLELLGTMFKESGGFVTTAIIGFVSCVAAPGSFMGASRSGRSARYAWLLTGIAVATAAISYFNQGVRLISIAVPIVVFLGSAIVLRRLLRSSSEA
jgi:hypothetical protein